MKCITGAAIAVGLLYGANASAQSNATAKPQEKAYTESTTKQTGPGPDSKTKMEKVTGTVKEYEAGKSIKISGPNDKTYSFSLDADTDHAARVEGIIVVGQPATVTYHKADNGIEHVAVISRASMDAKMDAKMDASAPKMHVESTTKQTGPGANTKVKTEVVVGTVKAYEAGEKLTVTGPKDKDYTFDLDDDNTAVKGSNVAVGQRVKVTFTKTDTGDKIIAVTADPAKP